MKTENKTTLKLVVETEQMLSAIKEFNIAASGNKNELKMIMKDLKTKFLIVGDYALVITDRTRMDLDKDKVKELLGKKYDSCLKKVEYQTFEIKKA